MRYASRPPGSRRNRSRASAVAHEPLPTKVVVGRDSDAGVQVEAVALDCAAIEWRLAAGGRVLLLGARALAEGTHGSPLHRNCGARVQ